MKFFIPNAPSDEEAEAFYEMNKNYNRQYNNLMLAGDITERRIQSIKGLEQEEAIFTATVGEEFQEYGIVMMILEADNYLICTLQRGTMSGEPILVYPGEVLSIANFD